jgi:hypothetical protein
MKLLPQGILIESLCVYVYVSIYKNQIQETSVTSKTDNGSIAKPVAN